MQPPMITSHRVSSLVTMTMFGSWVVTLVLKQFSKIRSVIQTADINQPTETNQITPYLRAEYHSLGREAEPNSWRW